MVLYSEMVFSRVVYPANDMYLSIGRHWKLMGVYTGHGSSASDAGCVGAEAISFGHKKSRRIG